MYFASSTLLLSLAATTLAWPFARPQDAAALAAAASKKNVYLSTCSTRGLLGFFDRDSTSTVIYYNGPSANRSPSDAAIVSEPARNWEGEQRRVRTVAGQFISSITDGAQDYPKNAISGTAKLGDEDMVCFKDGDSVFQFSEGLLGLRKTTCQAEYWCASIDL